ncbi:MAG: DnaJ domain-containing protein [Dehalococcoidia bacterium]|nr:DnaJ domain-containing protein [Dehalococcoidia bacterium]
MPTTATREDALRQAAQTKDYFAVLDVPATAKAEEIKAAYRRLSREHHPDRSTAPDANARMAELNEAYAVLSDPARRARLRDEAVRAERQRSRNGGLRREPPRPAPRPPERPPAEGRGAPQSARLPDWYAFLGVYDTASGAEILTALRRLRAEIEAANYAESDASLLDRQLREAADTLLTPIHRRVYDGALSGVPPRPGQYPHLHEDWYSFLGVSRRASVDAIAAQVTELSRHSRPASSEYREIEAAWRTLRDTAARAAYNAALVREGKGAG